MNRLKQLSMGGVMTLALASATFAGNIHTGAVPPPPPPREESLVAEPETLTAPDGIQTGLASSDFATELIWNLLQVFSLH